MSPHGNIESYRFDRQPQAASRKQAAIQNSLAANTHGAASLQQHAATPQKHAAALADGHQAGCIMMMMRGLQRLVTNSLLSQHILTA